MLLAIMVKSLNLEEITQKLDLFTAERDWDQFHTPKNLVMALTGEVGELAEIFQWLTEEQSVRLRENAEDLSRVSEELADIAIYTISLAKKLEIDLEVAINHKIQENAQKYPVDKSKGSAIKYNRR